jgi:SAM-dependent methyltransferase
MVLAGLVPPDLALPDLSHMAGLARLARPGQSGTGGAVADPLRLPFVESMFDRALVCSPLPATSARGEMREIWRILAPAGLALLVVPARRPWHFNSPGWRRARLAPLLHDAMFEVLDWQIETLPNRHHLVLLGKRDGLRPALVGRVRHAAPVTATNETSTRDSHDT